MLELWLNDEIHHFLIAIAFRIIGNLSISLSLLYCFQESVLITLIVDSQGWALRAGEAILRGTFVCEYIGEVLDEEKANKRRHRFLISSDRYSLHLLLSWGPAPLPFKPSIFLQFLF